MKNIKRFSVISLCIALAVTCFAGCHKKNETAVKIGDYTFSSGYYACALVYADTEGRQKVDEALTEKGKSTENVKYSKQKIDGVEFEKWVKDKAIENLKVNAGYRALCKDLKIKPSKDDLANAKNYAETYWTQYGYEQIFGENGVSKETFVKYTEDTYYSETYFDAVYGKDGSNPVTEEQLKTTLEKNYCLVYKLETDTSSMDEEAIKTKKAEYELYMEQFKAGVSFEEINKAANPTEETETTEETAETEEAESATETEETKEEETPAEEPAEDAVKDSNAELIGGKETNSYSEFYDDVVKMAVGESKILEGESKIALVIRLDIDSDPYYITSNDETLRKLYAGDTSNEDAVKKADKLGVKEIASATKIFKVNKIKYPESTTIGG